MANSIYGRVWTLDTIGLITRNPVTVRKAILYASATGDAATMYYWDDSDTIAAGVGEHGGVNGTITGNDTLTMASGTLLPSTITDGSIFEITASNGSADNVGKPMVVKTAGNNTVVVIHKIPAADQWTNEATKHYSWKTYQNRLAMKFVSATDSGTYQTDPIEPYEIDFRAPGFRFPNLTLETLSTGATISLYVD
jgi:hypothetical protein